MLASAVAGAAAPVIAGPSPMTASGIDVPTSLGGDAEVPAGALTADAAEASPEVPGAETVLLGAAGVSTTGTVGVSAAAVVTAGAVVVASTAGGTDVLAAAVGSAILLLMTRLKRPQESSGVERGERGLGRTTQTQAKCRVCGLARRGN